MKITEILLEYSRDVTAKNMGKQLVQALAYDRGLLPGNAGTHTQLYRNYLKQGTKESLQNMLSSDDPAVIETVKNIINSVLEAIEEKDPTPNKQYTQWLARMYAKGGLKIEDMNRANLLGLYDAAKKRRLIGADHADINKFKTYKDFEDTIHQYNLADKLAKAAAKKMSKGAAKEVYSDDSVRIIVPEDQEAACYYGQGTRWCTAATQGSNYFNQYNRSGPMYIMLPKQPKYQGEKYQLHFDSDQFMNEEDEPVSLVDLLKHRFPKTLQFFETVEPEIRNYIVFLPDDLLSRLAEEIRGISQEFIWDVIGDWEANDDYYYEWLEEKGYTDEAGHVDWDRVHADSYDYLSWSDSASDWVNKNEEGLITDPNEIRSLANEYETTLNDGEPLTIVRLPELIAYSVNENTRHDDISQDISDNIVVTKGSNGEWTARNIKRR